MKSQSEELGGDTGIRGKVHNPLRGCGGNITETIKIMWGTVISTDEYRIQPYSAMIYITTDEVGAVKVTYDSSLGFVPSSGVNRNSDFKLLRQITFLSSFWERQYGQYG